MADLPVLPEAFLYVAPEDLERVSVSDAVRGRQTAHEDRSEFDRPERAGLLTSSFIALERQRMVLQDRPVKFLRSTGSSWSGNTPSEIMAVLALQEEDVRERLRSVSEIPLISSWTAADKPEMTQGLGVEQEVLMPEKFNQASVFKARREFAWNDKGPEAGTM